MPVTSFEKVYAEDRKDWKMYIQENPPWWKNSRLITEINNINK